MVEKTRAFESARAAGEASIDWTEPQPNPITKLFTEITDAATAMLLGGVGADDTVGGRPVPAPCSANVWKVNVKSGQMVDEGEAVVVLEAMKMEYSVPSPCKGVVRTVLKKQGDAVTQGDVLISINEVEEVGDA